MEGVLPKGVLSGNGLCLEGVMYGGGFVRGGFVRRGFCPRTVCGSHLFHNQHLGTLIVKRPTFIILLVAHVDKYMPEEVRYVAASSSQLKDARVHHSIL